MPVLLLLLLGCAPEPLDPDLWPSEGCASAHAPAWDSVSELRSERIHLETPDGLELAAGLDRPKGDGCWPGLLFVPPGFESGLDEWGDAHTLAFARAGLVVMTLDVRGRGESEGEEAWAGPEQQDDVAGALAWLAAREDVDPTRVYVRSRSMGVALTGGALDRHPALEPAAWVDIEGPSTLPDDLEYADDKARETFLGAAEAEGADDQWWLDRSPVEHMGAFTGRYRRVQAFQDHALVFYKDHVLAVLETMEAGAPSAVDLNGGRPEDLGAEAWDLDVVRALVLEGSARHDDERTLELTLDALQP